MVAAEVRGSRAEAPQRRLVLLEGLLRPAVEDGGVRADGTDPDLEPCPELLDTLRARLHGLDGHIDALVRSRHALHDYIGATERRVSQHPPGCDTTRMSTPA